MVDIPLTSGALMLGGIIAIMFSGLTHAQTFLYFKLYPKDRGVIKLLVTFIWGLDTLHSAFITTALWDHLIGHYGFPDHIDYVPWSLGLTIAITAVLTFSVHLFLIFRIFRLSRRNLWITAPLTLMACCRLAFACLTTAKLVELRSLHQFVVKYTWSFTTGLTISTILDILITALLIILLRSQQKEHSSMNGVLDALALYTFETGGLTTLATAVCLITWLTMKENLIFMALHFVISKFYANSLLITLNTRVNLNPSSFRNGTQYSTFGTADHDALPLPGRTHPGVFATSPHNINRASNLVGVMSDGKVPGDVIRRYSDPDSLFDGDHARSRLSSSQGTNEQPMVYVESVATSPTASRHGRGRSATTVVHLTPNPTRSFLARVGMGDGSDENARRTDMQIRVDIDQTTVVVGKDDHAPLPKRRFLF